MRTALFSNRSYLCGTMADPKRLPLLCILATVWSVQEPTCSQTFDVPFTSATPVIDGALDATEWAGARYYEFSMVHNDGVTAHASTMLLMHDGTWLYLGINTGFASAKHLYWAIEFDGNNTHARDGNPVEPHIDIGFVCAGPGGASYYNRYDANLASGSIEVPPPIGTAKASTGSNPVTFEFKVKLAELGLAPGGIAGFKFQHGNDGIHAFGFPRVDPPMAEWPHLRILPRPLADGLVAYYPFDGDARDASGNGNHGVLSGATPTTDRSDAANRAYLFDGTGDFVNIVGTESLNFTGGFSLCAWVAFSVHNADQLVVGKHECGYNAGYALAVTQNRPNFLIANNAGPNRIYGPALLSDGNWHFLAGTFDSLNQHLYVDGLLVASQTMTFTLGNSVPLSIGGCTPGLNTAYFVGKIDDVRVYSRALSASEVLQLYTSSEGTTVNTTLSNVRAGQSEGSKTVRIYYDIAGAFQTIPVATMISTDDGQSYDLVGPSAAAVAPGNNRWLDWDAAGELPDQVNSRVRVKVIAGPAVAETPQSFTVDTRSAGGPGAVPAVVDIYSRYFWGKGEEGQHVFFLSGVSSYPAGLPFRQEVKVSVDWRGKLPGVIHYVCPEPYDGWENKRTFDIGSWSAGAKLTVIAEASDGTRSVPFPANFDVIPPPPGIASGLLYVKPLSDTLTYATPEFSFNVLDSNPEKVSEDVPIFGGQELGFVTAAKASAEVQSDGTASAQLSAGTGSKLPMAGFDVVPRLTGRPEWTYSPLSRQWVPAGYVGLEASASMSTPPAYVWATPPIFFRADVDVDTAVLFGVDGWDVAGKPILNGQWDLSAQVSGVAGCGASGFLAVEGYLGGGPVWTAQYPVPPVVKELGVELNGGVRLVLLFYTWDAGLLHYEWWLVGGGQAGRRALLRALEDQLNKPDSRQWEPMSRAYLSQATPYGKFVATKPIGLMWNDHIVPRIPLVLQTNIFPYSDPALGLAGANRMLLLVTDNPARSDENRTEMVWSKWNGSTWVNPTSVWNDATADFAPAVKAFPDGRALAVWQNERAVLPNGATLDDALAGLEIAVGWFDPAGQTWSCSNLTDNLTLDQGPKVAGAANGKALITWVSNPANNPLGSASEPSVVRSRFWDGAAWQDPSDIATNVGMLLWHTVAFDGTSGVMLATLDPDDDQSTIADQELYGATFNGGGWSEFTRLTTNSVQDTKPQAVFDSAGRLLVVWYQDTNLVMRTGSLDLSNPTVIGAVGGASSAKDFRLITGPDGQVTLLWEDVAEDGTGPDPFVFNYDYALGSWSQPLRLMQNTNRLERSFAGAYSDTGSLLLAYNQVNVQVDANGLPIPLATNQVDLMYLDYAIGGDLAIVPGSLMLSTNRPLPGETVQLSATVRNAGEKAATNIAAAFYSGGTLIGAPPTVPFLAAGASTNVSFDWTIPVGTTNQSVSVTVDPDQAREDRNRANNTASLIALAPELAITEMSVMNSARDRRMINARVVNQGNYACGSGFQVSFRRGAADGPVIGTVAVEAIPAGGQYDANLEWNLAGITFTNAYEAAYAEADAGASVADSDRSNNSSFVQLATTFDSDGDGLADADELRYGSDPHNPDTDGDGLLDGDEVYRYRASPVLADSDVDGMKDGDEVRAGTDPLSRDDLFAVVATDLATGHVRVQWSAKANRVYRVIKSLDLQSWADAPSGTTPEQQSQQTATADGVLEYFEPVAAMSETAFYRVRLVE